ncbi:hypothetical protein AWE51_09145 [Aquimarina aggregata]|uniref:DUF4468 domain-containing protein n=1 Tax=Aquimarina aggregata TaxID=1642818 RepID=A0A162ZHP0_9FLAO|nr:hypothetical protein [Aquimarina aggregata]KZS39805.1 hypothetical protein AWE51_09145 [Aquimarina aggregata]
MKKLFLLLFVLGASVTVQAQATDNSFQDWSVSNAEFIELYELATEIGKETDKVVANDNVISIVRNSGTTSFQRALDKSVTVEFYNFYLLTSQGQKINLNKGQTEKVLGKFDVVLKKVKQSLTADNTKAIDSILEDL